MTVEKNFSNIVGGFIKSVPSKQIFRDGFKDRFRDDFTDVRKTGVTEPSHNELQRTIAFSRN